MAWVIFNTNKRAWGGDVFPTREAAETELRTFWKGVSGVDFKKFEVHEVCGCDDCAALRIKDEIMAGHDAAIDALRRA